MLYRRSSHDDSGFEPLRARLGHRVLRQLRVAIPPNDDEEALDVAIYCYGRGGWKVWICLRSVHVALQLSQHNDATKWATRVFEQLQASLQSSWYIDAGAQFLRTKPYATAGEVAAKDSERTLQYHHVSVHAFMIVLYQWGTRRRHLGGWANSNDAEKARSLLLALCRIAASENFDIVLVDGDGWQNVVCCNSIRFD